MLKHKTITCENPTLEKIESKYSSDGHYRNMLEFAYHDVMTKITKNDCDQWLAKSNANKEFIFIKGNESIIIMLTKGIKFCGETLTDFRIVLERDYIVNLSEMLVESSEEIINHKIHKINLELDLKENPKIELIDHVLGDKFAFHNYLAKITQGNCDNWVCSKFSEDVFSFNKGETTMNIMTNKIVEFTGGTLTEFLCLMEDDYDIHVESLSGVKEDFNIVLTLTESVFK